MSLATCQLSALSSLSLSDLIVCIKLIEQSHYRSLLRRKHHLSRAPMKSTWRRRGQGVVAKTTRRYLIQHIQTLKRQTPRRKRKPKRQKNRKQTRSCSPPPQLHISAAIRYRDRPLKRLPYLCCYGGEEEDKNVHTAVHGFRTVAIPVLYVRGEGCIQYHYCSITVISIIRYV